MSFPAPVIDIAAACMSAGNKPNICQREDPYLPSISRLPYYTAVMRDHYWSRNKTSQGHLYLYWSIKGSKGYTLIPLHKNLHVLWSQNLEQTTQHVWKCFATVPLTDSFTTCPPYSCMKTSSSQNRALLLTLLLFVVDLMSFIVPNPEEQTKVQVLLSGNLFHSGVVSIAVILVY